MPDEIVVDDNTPLPQVREAHKRAEERARAAAELAGKVPHLERENALLRAGGDPDSRVGRLLLGDDEVEWTDREKVQAAWAEVAPPATPPPATEETPTDAPDELALARQERSERIQSGATVPGQEPTEHPWDEAHSMFLEGRRKNQGRERAAAPALDHIIDRAVAGDQRVIHDPRRPYSEQFEER